MFRKVVLSLCGLHLYITAAAFPLCMYSVNDPKDIRTLKKAGFTCLQTYKTDPELLAQLAQQAQKYGLQVVFYPNKIIGSAYEQQARTWPVLAWYLVDEPDVNHWSRERVAQAHQQAKDIFPNHQNAFVIGQGKTDIPFYDLADILMVDWYPIPHLALSSLGDNVRWAKEGQKTYGAAHKPLWAVVQSFDWKQFKQYRPDNERIGRFPTQEELRFMVYDAVLNGADGIFYFTFNYEKQPLPHIKPELWARVHNVNKELAKLLPVLEKGKIIPCPVDTAYPLVVQTRIYKNHRYTILANRSDKPVSTPPSFLTKTYKPLFGTSKTPQVPPYAVWVLKSKDK